MPELPEVETIVRSITPHLLGRTIRHVELYSERVTRGGLIETARHLIGSLIQNISRRGKQILIQLDHGILYIHLGMTGKLLWNAAAAKYTRALFELENGKLIYDDVRQFGRVEFFESMPPALDRIGPDALTVTFEDLYASLKRHRGNIKTFLLKQSVLAGVGNIYADEALFASSIHPRTQIARLSKKRVNELHRALIDLLARAIHHRGSSIADYVDAAGDRGAFQRLHQVYGREGQPCARCGARIRRIVVGQRGTHYCPRCQRA